jgi:hypothetical protein
MANASIWAVIHKAIGMAGRKPQGSERSPLVADASECRSAPGLQCDGYTDISRLGLTEDNLLRLHS